MLSATVFFSIKENKLLWHVSVDETPLPVDNMDLSIAEVITKYCEPQQFNSCLDLFRFLDQLPEPIQFLQFINCNCKITAWDSLAKMPVQVVFPANVRVESLIIFSPNTMGQYLDCWRYMQHELIFREQWQIETGQGEQYLFSKVFPS